MVILIQNTNIWHSKISRFREHCEGPFWLWVHNPSEWFTFLFLKGSRSQKYSKQRDIFKVIRKSPWAFSSKLFRIIFWPIFPVGVFQSVAICGNASPLRYVRRVDLDKGIEEWNDICEFNVGIHIHVYRCMQSKILCQNCFDWSTVN